MYPVWIAMVFMSLISTAIIVKSYEQDKISTHLSEDVEITRVVQYRLAVQAYMRMHPDIGDTMIADDQLSDYWTPGYHHKEGQWSNYIHGTGPTRTVYIFSMNDDLKSIGNALFTRASSSKLVGFKDPETGKMISLDHIPLPLDLNFVDASGQPVIPAGALVISGG